jgi:hypothetical protein
VPEQVVQLSAYPDDRRFWTLRWDARGVGSRMLVGDLERLGVGESGEGFGVEASRPVAVDPAVQGAGGEAVQVGAGIAD